jgi:hypothetical protein
MAAGDLRGWWGGGVAAAAAVDGQQQIWAGARAWARGCCGMCAADTGVVIKMVWQ